MAENKHTVLIDRSIEESVYTFKQRLQELKEEECSIYWQDCEFFSKRLRSLVDDLEAYALPPEIGLELVGDFFACDEAIMERCDDANRVVETVFTDSLTRLFHSYAKNVVDRELVMQYLINLSLVDYYGVRDALIRRAQESLSDEEIRMLIERFESLDGGRIPASCSLTLSNMASTLAAQLYDIKLYQRIILNTFGTLHQNALFTLAEMHIARQEFEEAQGRLEEIRPGGYNHRRNLLLREAHQGLGDTQRVIALCKESFDHSKSKEDFEALVAAAGEDLRQQILESEVAKIEANHLFQLRDLGFLIDTRRFESAERYLLSRADQVDGDQFRSLSPAAETLLAAGRLLGATLLFRRLLESILRRGHVKAYVHGIDFLFVLDDLEMKTKGWGPLEEHSVFKAALYAQHKQKRSFWSLYKNA